MNFGINPHFLWSKISQIHQRKQMYFPILLLALQFFPDIEILNLFYTIFSFVYPELRSI